MVFRIFNENIGLALSQTLPKSGNIPPSSLAEEPPVKLRPSTEVEIPDLQISASETIVPKDDVSSISGNGSVHGYPALQQDRETKALQTLKHAIEDLVDLGLEPGIIQNQFRQAISTLTQSIKNSRYTKVNLQEGEELDQRVKDTRQQILTESTRVITEHSNLKREGVLNLLK